MSVCPLLVILLQKCYYILKSINCSFISYVKQSESQLRNTKPTGLFQSWLADQPSLQTCSSGCYISIWQSDPCTHLPLYRPSPPSMFSLGHANSFQTMSNAEETVEEENTCWLTFSRSRKKRSDSPISWRRRNHRTGEQNESSTFQ